VIATRAVGGEASLMLSHLKEIKGFQVEIRRKGRAYEKEFR
jgi:hypothetical protein